MCFGSAKPSSRAHTTDCSLRTLGPELQNSSLLAKNLKHHLEWSGALRGDPFPFVYLVAIDVPLVAGRKLEPMDSEGAPPVWLKVQYSPKHGRCRTSRVCLDLWARHGTNALCSA